VPAGGDDQPIEIMETYFLSRRPLISLRNVVKLVVKFIAAGIILMP